MMKMKCRLQPTINSARLPPPPPIPLVSGYTGYNNKVQTPALKTFAAEGIVFTSWYSGWHLCSPSRASMLTGRLPPRTGVPSVGRLVLTAEAVGGLPLNETTFAEVLKASGYRTAMIGKWHLGYVHVYVARSTQSYLHLHTRACVKVQTFIIEDPPHARTHACAHVHALTCVIFNFNSPTPDPNLFNPKSAGYVLAAQKRVSVLPRVALQR